MNSPAAERNIAVTQHGRYRIAAAAVPAPILAGFHGYGESAEIELERLQAIDGAEAWHVLSIQGLNRFYRGRSTEVVAGWMTTQDRELAIADNCEYVNRVVDSVVQEFGATGRILFTGFSQGVAMAFRAAVCSTFDVTGVIACGGDVPPELDRWALAHVRRALLGRGSRDEWYTVQRLGEDERRLREAGVEVQTVAFEGGHEWSAEFRKACGAWLRC